MALDFPRSGDLHGALAVDYQCYRQAREADLRGSFRGFLAPAKKGGGTLESIVQFNNRRLPVVNARV